MPTPPNAPRDRDDASFGREVRQTLAGLMPWAVSIGAHVLLVVLAVFLVWTTVLTQEEEAWNGEVSFQPSPNVSPVQDTPVDPTPAPLRNTSPALQQLEVPQPILRNPGSNRPILGSPPPTLPDARPAPWTDTGLDPGSGVFGSVPPRTVFVIDASGSLIDTFPLVVNELKRLLRELAKAEQQRQAASGRHPRPYDYAVVFFRDGEVLTQDRRGLRSADTDQVARTIAWLDTVSPGGSTSPLPAIELALSLRPDAVILLSDNITGHGVYEIGTDELVERVMSARGDRATVIHTVQFVYPDPQEAYGRAGTLRRLAEETGGRYRFVDDRVLQLR